MEEKVKNEEPKMSIKDANGDKVKNDHSKEPIVTSTRDDRDRSRMSKFLLDHKIVNMCILSDGGMSAELLNQGFDSSKYKEWTAYANMECTELLQAAHEGFMKAGSRIITTNTYQHAAKIIANKYGGKLAICGYRSAINKSHASRDRLNLKKEVILMTSIGPYAVVLQDCSEYNPTYAKDPEALDKHIPEYYKMQLDMIQENDSDAVIFETIPSKADLDEILKQIESMNDKEFIISFACEGLFLRDGTPLIDCVKRLIDNDRIIACGVNCSHPRDGTAQIKEIASTGWNGLHERYIFYYPNSGESYNKETETYSGQATALETMVKEWFDAGAAVIGGCCRVGAPEIEKMRVVIDTEINKKSESPLLKDDDKEKKRRLESEVDDIDDSQ